MKHTLTVLALMVGIVLPSSVAAQDSERDSSWTVVYDDPSVADSTLFLVVMRPGWHITTPAASGVTLTQPDSMATNDFVLKSVIFTFNADAGAFGPAFAGKTTEGTGEIVGFLVNNDGTFGLFHYAGVERHTIIPWTATDAIVRQTEAGGSPVKNVVTVLVGDTLRFYINSTEVASMEREHSMDGGIGLRVDRGTNLHVSELTVAELGAGE